MTPGFSRRAMLGPFPAAAFLAAAAAGCHRPAVSPKSIHIANASGGLNVTMAELMRREKFLESFDLAPDMLAVADGSKVLAGVYSGSMDLSTMSGFGQVFPAIEHGADLKITNGAALLPLLALFTAKDHVRSLQDLEGKTVGVGSLGALVHQLTVTLLRKFSVDASRVRFLNVGSSTDIFRAVTAGTVDAGAGPASLTGDAESYQVRAIPNGNMSAELKEFTYQAGWTSARTIAAKRDTLVRVLAAYAKLFRFVQQPSAEEAFLKARRSVFPNAPDREHRSEWNYLQKYKPFASDLLLDPERIRYMQQINIDFQIQKEMLPFERVADMSLAMEAQRLLS